MRKLVFDEAQANPVGFRISQMVNLIEQHNEFLLLLLDILSRYKNPYTNPVDTIRRTEELDSLLALSDDMIDIPENKKELFKDYVDDLYYLSDHELNDARGDFLEEVVHKLGFYLYKKKYREAKIHFENEKDYIGESEHDFDSIFNLDPKIELIECKIDVSTFLYSKKGYFERGTRRKLKYMKKVHKTLKSEGYQHSIYLACSNLNVFYETEILTKKGYDCIKILNREDLYELCSNNSL